MLSLPKGKYRKLHPKGKYFRLPSSCGAPSSNGTGTASGPSLVCPSNMWESASPSWGWQKAMGREGEKVMEGEREKGRRENVIRKREKGKRFIEDSFFELQIFFTCSFQSLRSPFPATLLSSRGHSSISPCSCQKERLPAVCVQHFVPTSGKCLIGKTFPALPLAELSAPRGSVPNKTTLSCGWALLLPHRQMDAPSGFPEMEKRAGNGLATLPWGH